MSYCECFNTGQAFGLPRMNVQSFDNQALRMGFWLNYLVFLCNIHNILLYT